jgi:ectoine hydroxylase-related dioxygenase (phytanoyl-CoA dioxygenase family)
MQPANALLDDPDALRERFDNDGYLYFQRVLDVERVRALRRRMLTVLADAGWVSPRAYFMSGRCLVAPVREGDDDFFRAYDEVQKLEEFHSLAHDERLTDIMRTVLGDSAWPHPLKIARLSFPDHYEVSTPPHQDWPNNQGTERLTAAWVPVGDIPAELGGLAILRGSHKWGPLPLTVHLGAGNRRAVLPEDMLEQCRWVSTEFALGDVLVFLSTTVHASLHNASEFFMRLSVDFRYQLEGEELTPGVLEPHFGRLSWPDIYRDWKSDRYQYYWRDKRYEVVPFRDIPLVGEPVGASDDEIRALAAYEQRRAARVERRLETLSAILADEDARGAAELLDATDRPD